MKNPTVKQVNFVIGRLLLVKNDALKEGAFDIAENRVYSKKSGYECGTVHCVAGWYVVANLHRKEIKDRVNKGYVDYNAGTKLMANDLGFIDKFELRDWAHDNPKIWDNLNGYDMFTDELAYNNPGFEGVISQLRLVKQNLIELRVEK